MREGESRESAQGGRAPIAELVAALREAGGRLGVQ